MKNYDKFLCSSYKGVQGVTVIESKKPGKNIGIFAINHGNEPVGLQVFDYLLQDYDVQKKLISGKIYLISINIAAYKKFIQQNDNLAYRILDHNMNRIHGQDFIGSSYEFQRKRALEPILDELDMALDLHSVPTGNEPIGLADLDQTKDALEFMHIPTLFVDTMASSGALIGYLIQQGKVAFGLECGNHTDNTAYQNGVRNTLNFLSYYGALEEELVLDTTPTTAYSLTQEVIAQSLDFHYLKNFVNYDSVGQGETYARDGDKVYHNDFGKIMYLGLLGNKLAPGGGMGFLMEKLQ